MATLQKHASTSKKTEPPKKESQPPIQRKIESPCDWAVIGGGVLGMTLAHRLREQGNNVTLIESSDHFGGLADGWRIGNVVWDRHPHVIQSSDHKLLALLETLELSDQLSWGTTNTGFYSRRRWYELSSLQELFQYSHLAPIDRFRVGLALTALKIAPESYLRSAQAEQWLRKWSGNRTYENFWAPLLNSRFGSRTPTAPMAFVRSFIKKSLAGRAEDTAGYLNSGYADFQSHFVELLDDSGVMLHASSPVASVARTRNGVQIDYANQRKPEIYDQVAVTLPSSVASGICKGLSPEEGRLHADVPYLGVVCASLLLNRPLKGYFETQLTDEAPFSSIIEMTRLVDSSRFEEKTLVYLPKYADPSDPIFEKSNETIQQTFWHHLTQMIPDLSKEDLEAFRISKVRQAFAMPQTDTPLSGQTSVPGIHIVNGSQVPGGCLSLNETINLAQNFATSIEAAANP